MASPYDADFFDSCKAARSKVVPGMYDGMWLEQSILRARALIEADPLVVENKFADLMEEF